MLHHAALKLHGLETALVAYPHAFQTIEDARDWLATYRNDRQKATGSVRQWLRTLIAEHKPQWLHSHNSHIPNSPAIANVIEEEAAIAGIPHVLTVHDLTVYPEAHALLKELKHTKLVTQSIYNQGAIHRAAGRPANSVFTTSKLGLAGDTIAAWRRRAQR